MVRQKHENHPAYLERLLSIWMFVRDYHRFVFPGKASAINRGRREGCQQFGFQIRPPGVRPLKL